MEPIDFCIALSGPNLSRLWPIFWTTLNRHCDLSGVKFHLVNKDIEGIVMDKIMSLIMSAGKLVVTYSLPRSECPTPDGLTCNSRIQGDDVGYTCDYMVRNCGEYKWMAISHFDMWFKQDWLTSARKLIADNVGMIGHHCPIMLLNRDAYKKTTVGFYTTSGFVAVPHGDPKCNPRYKLHHESDERALTLGSITIEGLDIGELLEIELRMTGWRVDQSLGIFNEEPPTDEGHRWYHHIGNGSCRDEIGMITKKQQCIEIASKLGINL